MTTRRVLVLAGLVATLSACHPTPGEKENVRRWLLCEECNEGELEAVVPLGDRVTGMLRDALLQGPSATHRKHIQRQARERFDRLSSPTLVTAASYVNHYDSNYIANYQAHAAIALGRIGTADARAALAEALQRDSSFRYDVLRELGYAAPIALDTASGGNQSAPLDSVARIDPTVRLRDSVSGQGLADVLVGFTIDSGGGHVDTSLRRTDANGRASVRWTLGPGPDSSNVLRAETFRRIVLFRATGHGLTPRLVFAAQPLNGTSGQPLLPGIQALVLDAWNQRDTTFSGAARALIIGTADTVNGQVVKGVVDFPNLVPSVLGTFRIRVEAAGATPAVSQLFDIVP
jgi:hypothetical protein